jgi:hypothetical protein
MDELDGYMDIFFLAGNLASSGVFIGVGSDYHNSGILQFAWYLCNIRPPREETMDVTSTDVATLSQFDASTATAVSLRIRPLSASRLPTWLRAPLSVILRRHLSTKVE